MKIKLIASGIAVLLLTFGCTSPEESESVVEIIPIDTSINPGDSIIAYKPNIYIYPEYEVDLSVRLTFPNGGRVTVSEPEYDDGWSVNVSDSGLIDDEFTFLFYECKIPDYCQYDEGWIIEESELRTFFDTELRSLRFNEFEIGDFLNYWMPLLKDHDEYLIYPQYSETLEQIVTIDCDVEPDFVNRVWYVVREYSGVEEPPVTPDSEIFSREGFHIMEWGVIL